MKQRSIFALREKARDGLLVYIENNGAVQFFDQDLSIVRENAASKCKRPGVTWKRILIAINALDRRDINSQIIRVLNTTNSTSEATKFLVDKIKEEIG